MAVVTKRNRLVLYALTSFMHPAAQVFSMVCYFGRKWVAVSRASEQLWCNQGFVHGTCPLSFPFTPKPTEM
jgi:hypothetical protein